MVFGSGSSCAASHSSTLALAPFPSLATMAHGGAVAMEAAGAGEVDLAGAVAAGIASESHIAELEAELKAMTDAKQNKSKEVKKEKQKRDRLMTKAGKNLSIEDLSQLLAAKAKAKAKAKPKAKAKAAAAPAAGGEAAPGE